MQNSDKKNSDNILNSLALINSSQKKISQTNTYFQSALLAEVLN